MLDWGFAFLIFALTDLALWVLRDTKRRTLLCCFRSWGLVQSGSKGQLCIPFINKSHGTPRLLQWKLFLFGPGFLIVWEEGVSSVCVWLPGHWAECLSQDIHTPACRIVRSTGHLSPRKLDTKCKRRCEIPAPERWGMLTAYSFHEGDSLREWQSPLSPLQGSVTSVRDLLNCTTCRVLVLVCLEKCESNTEEKHNSQAYRR